MSSTRRAASSPAKQRRDASLMAIGTALPVLHRNYRAAVDRAAAPSGLSLALAWPLVMIGRHSEGLRQGVLADRLGIEPPSLIRSIEQLLEAGLIDRHEDPADRRAKTLHLTEEGATATAKIESELTTLRASLFEGIADADIDTCLRVFGALGRNLGCALPDLPAQQEPVST